MKSKNAFQLLVETFESEEIEYALIGALAANAHGYARATRDADFITRCEDQTRVLPLLEALGFETTYKSAGYTRHANVGSGVGGVDLVYVRGETANKIFRDASILSIPSGVRLPVVSPEHLVALKVFAMKKDSGRSSREITDIQRLIALTGLSPQSIRKYFEHYEQMPAYSAIIGE